MINCIPNPSNRGNAGESVGMKGVEKEAVDPSVYSDVGRAMGWINQGKVRSGVTADAKGKGLQKAAEEATSTRNLEYGYCHQKTPEAELPFIPADVVKKRSGKGANERLWIVFDKVVYDCTDWAAKHPGGSEVIESFGGRDCSWQFWRFHSREQMQQFGMPLRIGQTDGVSNPYEEPERYSRLRAFDEEDW